jgi:hypothetical protein
MRTSGRQNLVAAFGEHAGRQRTYLFLVLDDQDRLGPIGVTTFGDSTPAAASGSATAGR